MSAPASRPALPSSRAEVPITSASSRPILPSHPVEHLRFGFAFRVSFSSSAVPWQSQHIPPSMNPKTSPAKGVHAARRLVVSPPASPANLPRARPASRPPGHFPRPPKPSPNDLSLAPTVIAVPSSASGTMPPASPPRPPRPLRPSSHLVMHATNVTPVTPETCGTPVNPAKATPADRVLPARRANKARRPNPSHSPSRVAIRSSNTAVGVAVEGADIPNIAKVGRVA